MKDERGLYYFPNAADHRARMYVRRGEDGGVQFRLWQSDHPEVWDRHQWLDLQVIEDAARLYREERNADADPLKLYDAAVARALLEEARRLLRARRPQPLGRPALPAAVLRHGAPLRPAAVLLPWHR